MKTVWLVCLPCLVAALACPRESCAQDYPRPAVDLPLLLQELVARPENEDLPY